MDDTLVTALENFRIAQFKSDLSSLKALVDPRLSYSHSNGKVQNASDFLTASTNGRYEFNEIKYSNPTFLMEGNTGVIRFDWEAQQTWADKSITHTRLSILMVRVKADRGWQVLARSATNKLAP